MPRDHDIVMIVDDLADVRRILTESSTIAVLGAHIEKHRAAFYVPDYLHGRGYRILPVNPMLVGHTLWGEPFRARLGELDQAVDLVDVFRAADKLPAHVEDIMDMSPRPKTVWFQLGIRNDEVAATLTQSGFAVVQDRCTLADHKRLRL